MTRYSNNCILSYLALPVSQEQTLDSGSTDSVQHVTATYATSLILSGAEHDLSATSLLQHFSAKKLLKYSRGLSSCLKQGPHFHYRGSQQSLGMTWIAGSALRLQHCSEADLGSPALSASLQVCRA